MAKKKNSKLRGAGEDFLRGIPVGIANVIPGVSGGTIALLMGIYDRLMDAIGNFFKKLKRKDTRNKNLLFLASLGLGAALGIVLFFKLVEIVVENGGTLPLYALFAGLIAGSVPFILSIRRDMKPTVQRLLAAFIGFALVLGLTLCSEWREEHPVVRGHWEYHTETVNYSESAHIEQWDEGSKEVTTKVWVEDEFSGIGYYLWLSLCGFLAAGSMIVPGFSGSALLVALGEWENIGMMVSNFEMLPLGFVGLGALLGVFLFAKLIALALKKAPAATYYFILGLILASFYQIWTEVSGALKGASAGLILLSVALLGIGFMGAYLLGKLDKKPATKK